MLALKSLPHFSYSDYKNWEGNWELINGIPYAMSPAPAPRHQFIATELAVLLRQSLKESNCRKCKVYQFIDYKIEDDIIVQPDISIVCKTIKKLYLDFKPELVVEILSPSTRDKDIAVKLPLYQSKSIKWYLIIDPEKEVVDVYELIHGEYEQVKRIQNETYYFPLESGCTTSASFKEIWE